jgi:hypothetical protein
MPVTYVDKSVQDMPVQVKGIYTNDRNVLACCGHFIENSREQFLLLNPSAPEHAIYAFLRHYQEWGIASIAIPESAWDSALCHRLAEADVAVSPTLEVFVCRGE